MIRHLLNIIIYITLLVAFPIHVRADDEARRVHLSLEQESYLVIYGKSNIHSFRCSYRDLEKDTMNVNVYWQDDCLVFQEAAINLSTESFDCGNKNMNEDLQELLKADTYPDISIVIDCIDVSDKTGEPVIPVKNNPGNISVIADIHIAGQSQRQRIPVQILKKEDERNYTGSILLDLQDFNIDPPTKMLGLIKVDNIIEVHFYIKISIIDTFPAGSSEAE